MSIQKKDRVLITVGTLGGLEGVVKKVSKRTGGLSVILTTGRGAYTPGTLVHINPYEVQKIVPMEPYRGED